MPKSKSRTKKTPKRVPALPDLEHAKTAVLNSLTSASGQRTYDHAIRRVSSAGTARSAGSRSTAPSCSDTGFTSSNGYAPATINLRLAAVRRIAYEAADGRTPDSRTGGWYPSGEGGATDRRAPQELANA